MGRRRLPGVLTPMEIEALRAVIVRPRDRAAVSLMLDAGLRVSEVVNLRLQNIDAENQVLRFVGKGNKEAELPISNRLRDELEQAIKTRPPQATHDYLIWHLRDPTQPISRFALLKLVKTYARKAGLRRRVYCHLLRHTFGTNIFRANKDLGRTQAAMRHSKPTTTTIYMHLNAEDQRPDFEAIDKRPWLIQLWSRLKPNVEFWQPRPKPFYIGKTIGREKEITQLRKNVQSRRHTVLVGERGTGRRHLLHQLEGERIYRLEEFKPSRESLVELCQQLQQDGILAEMPTGRSITPLLRAVQAAGRAKELTLVIDSITDITKTEIRPLRKIAQTWVICTAIDRRGKGRIGEIFLATARSLSLILLIEPLLLHLPELLLMVCMCRMWRRIFITSISTPRATPRPF